VFEVLIVDNCSTDGTPERVQAFIAEHPKHRIRYIREDTPGLLAGRHRGLKETLAEILTFLEDDVRLGPEYALHILKAFADEKVALVGGPCVPIFESEPPVWVEHYCRRQQGRFDCAFLGLLDYGDKEMDIAPEYVWGLNFSVRKQVLLDAGGFHPALYPKELEMFTGNGESGPTLKIKEQNMIARYVPGVRVEHIIPSTRLTEEYFKSRLFYQGIMDSYTAIRRDGITQQITYPQPLRENVENAGGIHERIHNAYVDGYLFHYNGAIQSPNLLAWIKKDNYFDYSLPKLEEGINFRPDWSDDLLQGRITDISVVPFKTIFLVLNSAVSPHMRSVIENGAYEHQEIDYAMLVSDPNDVVLELGAGIGALSTCVASAENVKKIICVEANPHLIPLIKQTHALNKVNNSIVLHGVMQNEAMQETAFYLYKDFWCGSLKKSPEAIGVVNVPVYNFNAALRQYSPTFLIVDIEGGEYSLFNDDTDFSSIKKILIEVHGAIRDRDNLCDLFVRKGFHLKNPPAGAVLYFHT
jgi:FkbM family methyltransferase